MISIFNGRKRTIGKESTQECYIKVEVDFRKYLHLFKGAKLAVFMCISLHADEDGWAFPKIATIAKETGYSEDTVFDALKELEEMRINDSPLILRHQPKTERGIFQSNRYQIFPDPDENQSGFNRPDISPTRTFTDTVKHRDKEEPVINKNHKEKKNQDSLAAHAAIDTKIKKERPKNQFVETFKAQFLQMYGVNYQERTPDFVHLASLRLVQKELLTDVEWDLALKNYFQTQQKVHTLADLCVNYATFHKSPIDRFNRPIQQAVFTERKAVIPG